jgi:hypothetical protein
MPQITGGKARVSVNSAGENYRIYTQVGEGQSSYAPCEWLSARSYEPLTNLKLGEHLSEHFFRRILLTTRVERVQEGGNVLSPLARKLTLHAVYMNWHFWRLPLFGGLSGTPFSLCKCKA